ncbi:SDR family NAD(P)-dependent oxidoreductase [Cohnella candidum]|uniref:SDR family NAD(P)-dependent oxidoreductase n=1 Tax=Cohnella candidum TaxID=2674991 RepID=A0A3G3JYM0_9BACL|nr:SDR family NAD(P)-dependent oxidoreductase [Cohnella candidum]AYQ73356.1 SDR family NAD(P)-dependent oxidoreductase [Cohnella candidum]
MELKGKTALVTGGGTGIGRAASLTLAEKGAFVAVNYSRSKKDAEETVRMIEERGGSAIAVKADVSNAREVDEMVERIVERYGSLDLLVNNASITHHVALPDLDGVEDTMWDELFAVNVKGMFHCARAAAPWMKKSGRGAIVNLGSIAGITGVGSSLPYAVSKAAVHGLTKSLAHALAPEIRVCSVVPGAVETRWWAGREEKMRALSPQLPLRRVSTPEDIAHFICAVLEQEAITGQIITVDSGQTM